VDASRTNRQIARPDGAYIRQLVGVPPDIDKFRFPDVPAGERELDTGKNVAVGREITGSVAGAAGHRVQIILIDVIGRRAEFVDISADEARRMERLAKLCSGNIEGQ